MDDRSIDVQLVVRLERFCAALYRAVPVEGEGLLAQASELAHAADLDVEADRLAADDADDQDGSVTVLTRRDIRQACQLLIDARRRPAGLHPAELALVRAHFPEVDDTTLDGLEHLVQAYTDLLR